LLTSTKLGTKQDWLFDFAQGRQEHLKSYRQIFQIDTKITGSFFSIDTSGGLLRILLEIGQDD